MPPDSSNAAADDDTAELAEGNKWVTPLTTPRGELSPGLPSAYPRQDCVLCPRRSPTPSWGGVRLPNSAALAPPTALPTARPWLGQRFAPEDRLDVVSTGSLNDHAIHFLEGLSNERATEVHSVAVQCVQELARRGHRKYISQISNMVSMMEIEDARSECQPRAGAQLDMPIPNFRITDVQPDGMHVALLGIQTADKAARQDSRFRPQPESAGEARAHSAPRGPVSD